MFGVTGEPPGEIQGDRPSSNRDDVRVTGEPPGEIRGDRESSIRDNIRGDRRAVRA
jgi:hypothetical protein